jgi:hypothetical protein
MKNINVNRELNDIEKIKNFLVGIKFMCSSSPSAQYLIYSKNSEVVMIKNNKKK